jgi:CheY-like chemotaxis protein
VVIDLNAEMAQLVTEIQRSVGAAIEVKLGLGNEPACARLDPAQFHQCVMHLVENARDAMPSGGTLTIDVEAMDLAGFEPTTLPATPTPCVMIALSDTGMGMGEQTRTHAFDPRFTTKSNGQGMGLASVREIVDQSGGAIWLDSSPNEGTTLALYFPRVVATTPRHRPGQHWAPSKPLGNWILLVDDEVAVRRAVGRLLRTAGFAVVQAGSPEEAVEVARKHGTRLGLVLTDVEMPTMSGMDLVDKLRGSIPNLRALYMSGRPADAIGDVDPSRRCQPFVQKPMRKPELLSAIRAVLSGQLTLAPQQSAEREPAVEVA